MVKTLGRATVQYEMFTLAKHLLLLQTTSTATTGTAVPAVLFLVLVLLLLKILLPGATVKARSCSSGLAYPKLRDSTRKSGSRGPLATQDSSKKRASDTGSCCASYAQ